MVKWRNRLKFTACCRQEVSKASIPQILFQAIVASFRPRKPAFLRLFLVGIMAKNYTALNKRKTRKARVFQGFSGMVRMTGLEPTWIASLEPETSASANSATSAFFSFCPLLLHGENTRGGAYYWARLFQHTPQKLHRGSVTWNQRVCRSATPAY